MLHVAVIMAGGSGERFWPVSRVNRPKQLLRLVTPDRSMLQEALDHVTPLIPPRQVYVQTSGELADAIRRETPELPPDNIPLVVSVVKISAMTKILSSASVFSPAVRGAVTPPPGARPDSSPR